ncbi:tetratricopeptide repeat protein [Solihabitans fulvus]|uniref:Tetratricopeptide repeat protein n=1 Tax=Solihabitans fulvus TaxID=1892852 RepID=A0A5B2XUH8_9PSEU|nr:tetratricopeptide repeat protein [Solihabitans fulvus]
MPAWHCGNSPRPICLTNIVPVGSRSTSCCAPTPPSKPPLWTATRTGTPRCTGCWTTTCTPAEPRPCWCIRPSNRSPSTQASPGDTRGTHRRQPGPHLVRGGAPGAARGPGGGRRRGLRHPCLAASLDPADLHCQQSLALDRELGNRLSEAGTLESLGYIHHRLGHHAEAVDCYQQALALCAELGDRYDEAAMHSHLGDVHQAVGNHDAARESWRRAHTILSELRHPDAEQVRAKIDELA